jgi:hypothetical protein
VLAALLVQVLSRRFSRRFHQTAAFVWVSLPISEWNGKREAFQEAFAPILCPQAALDQATSNLLWPNNPSVSESIVCLTLAL